MGRILIIPDADFSENKLATDDLTLAPIYTLDKSDWTGERSQIINTNLAIFSNSFSLWTIYFYIGRVSTSSTYSALGTQNGASPWDGLLSNGDAPNFATPSFGIVGSSQTMLLQLDGTVGSSEATQWNKGHKPVSIAIRRSGTKRIEYSLDGITWNTFINEILISDRTLLIGGGYQGDRRGYPSGGRIKTVIYDKVLDDISQYFE